MGWDLVEALSASVVHLKRWSQTLPRTSEVGRSSSGQAPAVADMFTMPMRTLDGRNRCPSDDMHEKTASCELQCPRRKVN